MPHNKRPRQARQPSPAAAVSPAHASGGAVVPPSLFRSPPAPTTTPPSRVSATVSLGSSPTGVGAGGSIGILGRPPSSSPTPTLATSSPSSTDAVGTTHGYTAVQTQILRSSSEVMPTPTGATPTSGTAGPIRSPNTLRARRFPSPRRAQLSPTSTTGAGGGGTLPTGSVDSVSAKSSSPTSAVAPMIGAVGAGGTPTTSAAAAVGAMDFAGHYIAGTGYSVLGSPIGSTPPTFFPSSAASAGAGGGGAGAAGGAGLAQDGLNPGLGSRDSMGDVRAAVLAANAAAASGSVGGGDQRGVTVFFPQRASEADLISAHGGEKGEGEANLDLAQVPVEGFYEHDLGVLIPSDLPRSTVLYVLTASDGRDLMFKIVQYSLQLMICMLKTPSLFSPEALLFVDPLTDRFFRNYNTIRHGRSLFKVGRGLLNLFTLQTVCERMWMRYHEEVKQKLCWMRRPLKFVTQPFVSLGVKLGLIAPSARLLGLDDAAEDILTGATGSIASGGVDVTRDEAAAATLLTQRKRREDMDLLLTDDLYIHVSNAECSGRQDLGMTSSSPASALQTAQGIQLPAQLPTGLVPQSQQSPQLQHISTEYVASASVAPPSYRASEPVSRNSPTTNAEARPFYVRDAGRGVSSLPSAVKLDAVGSAVPPASVVSCSLPQSVDAGRATVGATALAAATAASSALLSTTPVASCKEEGLDAVTLITVPGTDAAAAAAAADATSASDPLGEVRLEETLTPRHMEVPLPFPAASTGASIGSFLNASSMPESEDTPLYRGSVADDTAFPPPPAVSGTLPQRMLMGGGATEEGSMNGELGREGHGNRTETQHLLQPLKRGTVPSAEESMNSPSTTTHPAAAMMTMMQDSANDSRGPSFLLSTHTAGGGDDELARADSALVTAMSSSHLAAAGASAKDYFTHVPTVAFDEKLGEKLEHKHRRANGVPGAAATGSGRHASGLSADGPLSPKRLSLHARGAGGKSEAALGESAIATAEGSASGSPTAHQRKSEQRRGADSAPAQPAAKSSSSSQAAMVPAPFPPDEWKRVNKAELFGTGTPATPTAGATATTAAATSTAAGAEAQSGERAVAGALGMQSVPEYDDSEISLINSTMASSTSSSFHCRNDELLPASAATPARWRKSPLQFNPLLMTLLGVRSFAAACRRFLRDLTMICSERFFKLDYVEANRASIHRRINILWLVVATIDLLLNTIRLLQPGWVKYAMARQNVLCRCACSPQAEDGNMVWRAKGFVTRRKTDLFFPALNLDYGAPYASYATFFEAADPVHMQPACHRCGYIYKEATSTATTAAQTAAAAQAESEKPRWLQLYDTQAAENAEHTRVNSTVDAAAGASAAAGAGAASGTYVGTGAVASSASLLPSLAGRPAALATAGVVSSSFSSPPYATTTAGDVRVSGTHPRVPSQSLPPALAPGPVVSSSSGVLPGKGGISVAATNQVAPLSGKAAARAKEVYSAEGIEPDAVGFLFVPWFMRKIFNYVWLLRVHPNLSATLLVEVRYLAEFFLAYKYCFGGYEGYVRDNPIANVLHPAGAMAGLVSALVGMLRVIESAPK